MKKTAGKVLKGKEQRRRGKTNLMGPIAGLFLLLTGLLLLVIKAVSLEYIDEMGILREKFFLLPIAYLFILSGVVVLFVFGGKCLAHKFSNKSKQ
ncbi:MAG: DUF3955 domain-containing protein [Tissierellia bacterium]|jgi:uncharacterized membrane protein SirB2|nr:DUF3955 domain-containing protein [Tissierellia bacterium]